MPLVGIRLETAVPSSGFVPTLDAEQQRVVDHRGGPLLVLAGPGTGKTTTLVEVVADRLAKGQDPSRILLLTFGRKAAGEIRERLASRLSTIVAPRVWTFHGWCYSLLCELPSGRPALVTGPEQDSIIKDLLAGSLAEGTGAVAWPEHLRPAVQTRTFAEQFRELISRALDKGMGPPELRDAGRAAERVDWQLGAAIFQDYVDFLESTRSLDYSSLIDEVSRAMTDGRLPGIADRYDLVIVDEYQDTDAAQVALLQAVSGGGRELIAIGDPDQSIYAFRGADVRGILSFTETFRDRTGAPATSIELRTSGRAGATLLATSRLIAAPLQYAGSSLTVETLQRHRDLTPRAGTPDGEVEVVTLSGEGAQARWIAERLRAEHIEHGTSWSDMAVIVRSTAAMGPLRRALISYSVPVEVAGDEMALSEHPIVRTMLSALKAVSARRVDGELRPIPDGTLLELLSSAIIGADPALVRKLGRHLRRQDRLARPGVPPRSADVLIPLAVRDTTLLLTIPTDLSEPVRRLAALIADAQAAVVTPGGAIEALWLFWSASSWLRELRGTSLAGGHEGVLADSGLDAVLALFSTVTDLLERRPNMTADLIVERIEHLQIPGDVRAEAAIRGDAVRLLTAHRSKGLEWGVVVVAGAQDGSWPDVRSRGSMLDSDRLGRDGLTEPITRGELLAEERRLFYVAATRAKSRLIVTAVDGGEGGDRPSAFLSELVDGEPEMVDPQRRRRATRLPDLVAQLRRVLVESEDEVEKEQAGATLAWLAVQRDDEGRLLCAAADPRTWWGSAPPTENDVPIRPLDAPLKLSGSTLSSIKDCPQRWAFEHEVRAGAASANAAMFGGVVHALVEELANDELQPEDIEARLDSVWSAMTYTAKWESDVEREAALAAIHRFQEWQRSRTETTLAGSELTFDITVETIHGPVRLTGAMDRVERDEDGRLIVFDFKTTRQAPTKDEAELHPQMGLYQLAIRDGGLDRFGDVAPGGAGLVHLRLPKGTKEEDRGQPKVLMQSPLGEEGPIDEQLAKAAGIVRSERFEAIVGDACTFCVFQTSCPAHDHGTRVVP